MTSNTIATTKKFTISLTKAKLDAIQKQLIEEYERMLDRVRRMNSVPSSSNSEKSYCNTIVRDNVTVTLSLKNKNKINKINNNNNNKLKNEVNVTVTISCLLL
jgi:hypothetical protein